MERSAKDSIKAEHSETGLFFEKILSAFEKASRKSGGNIDHFYEIAGSRVCFRFAGSALVPLISPAFAHLKVTCDKKPELTVLIWDSFSTKTALPATPRLGENIRALTKRWRILNKRFLLLFYPENKTLYMLDKCRNTAVFWVQNYRKIVQYEIGSPLLAIFNLWFRCRSIQLVHAGAVGGPEGGVLIVGKGGSGKSTTVLSCLENGLLYTGDDYCLLSANPIPYVYSIYSTAKIFTRDKYRFPGLEPALMNISVRENIDKSVFSIHRIFPRKILRRFPLKAVVIPKIIEGACPRLVKASSASGLLALGPSTLFQLPGYDRQMFQNLGRVVKMVPNYVLECSKNFSQNAVLISRLLSGDMI
ncbi:MAG: serine kinase [Candidatus Aminicenantes bacterium]|nr:serine kinase [Candidatus Aminicenantes bacterium]